jgi:hypothetical protein
MKALGYLSLNEKSSGFYCKRYSPTHKSGFIQVSPEMAQEIMTNIGTAPGIIKVRDFLAHEGSIDDAYFNISKTKLQFVIGYEIQEVFALAPEATRVLQQLARNPGFAVVSNDSESALSDVVHFDRVTRLTRQRDEDSTEVVTENLPFPVGLNVKDTQPLFDRMEEEGLATASKAAKLNPWTRDLSDTLEKLPTLAVRVAPVISQETPQILLQQALGQGEASNNAPDKKKLKEIFATVATLPPAYGQFQYPDNKKSRKEKPKAAKKPKAPKS